MKFSETRLPGVYLVDIVPHEDERGFFARSWCADEWLAQGLNPCLAQCNISLNRHRGTLRGMHFQTVPHQEAKLVRVTRGTIWDVALDMRPASLTFGQWEVFELSADGHRALYLGEGVAHGFQTLVDDTEVFYQMSTPYQADASRGVRWDDPRFGIAWPLPQPIMSERDRSYPLWSALQEKN